MKYIKKIIYFLFFALLLYSENLFVGEMSFSQVWKVPLIIYLFILLIYKKKESPQYIRYGYIYSFFHIIKLNLFTNTLHVLIQTIKSLNTLLLFDVLNTRVRDANTIRKFLISLSFYFIFFHIPYLIGWLEEVQSSNLIIYGKTELYKGYFQSAHAASICTTLNLFVLIFFVKYQNNTYRLLYSIAICIGLIVLYKTFVRTGWLMFICGIYFVVMETDNKRSSLIRLSLLTIILFILASYMFQIDDFQLRFFDGNKDYLNYGNIGSGRLIFIQHALDYWFNSSFFHFCFGMGNDGIQNLLYNKVGLAIGTHNGFVDALTMHGFFAFIFLFTYFLFMGKYIYRRRNTHSFFLILAFYVSYITCYITQGNIGFQLDLYAALFLVLITKEFEEKKIYENINHRRLQLY